MAAPYINPVDRTLQKPYRSLPSPLTKGYSPSATHRRNTPVPQMPRFTLWHFSENLYGLQKLTPSALWKSKPTALPAVHCIWNLTKCKHCWVLVWTKAHWWGVSVCQLISAAPQWYQYAWLFLTHIILPCIWCGKRTCGQRVPMAWADLWFGKGTYFSPTGFPDQEQAAIGGTESTTVSCV